MLGVKFADIDKADPVAVALGHATCPLAKPCPTPLESMVGMAFLSGRHAMQDVVFDIGRSDQYHAGSHTTKHGSFDPREAARVDMFDGLYQRSGIEAIEL